MRAVSSAVVDTQYESRERLDSQLAVKAIGTARDAQGDSRQQRLSGSLPRVTALSDFDCFWRPDRIF